MIFIRINKKTYCSSLVGLCFKTKVVKFNRNKKSFALHSFGALCINPGCWGSFQSTLESSLGFLISPPPALSLRGQRQSSPFLWFPAQPPLWRKEEGEIRGEEREGEVAPSMGSQPGPFQHGPPCFMKTGSSHSSDR